MDSHSIVALVRAHAVAPIFPIPQGYVWWVSTAALVAVLFVAALCTWHETMKMVEFQSFRQQKSHTTDQVRSHHAHERAGLAQPGSKGVPE
jgi:ABC-type nickel/cobalt efflux system permease component RcnA